VSALSNLRDAWESRSKSTSNADSEQATQGLAEQLLRELADKIQHALLQKEHSE
jgi:hypothetical protein